MTNPVPTVGLGDGLNVSVIGFGAMALTAIYGAVDDTESLATLNHCLDVGVTFIDTANIYGGGETARPAGHRCAGMRPTSGNASTRAWVGWVPTSSSCTTCTAAIRECLSRRP